jgi:hypothetical protein
LDAKAIAEENGAIVALLNGPRYWLMSSIGKRDRETMVRKTFGRLEMNRQATVALSSMKPAPYSVNKVDRKAVFTFDAGREVYELVDPDGRRWITQTYSQTVDPHLRRDQLPGLAGRLSLPTGWSYVASTPAAAVVVDTTGREASVIQDDLANTYSLRV